MVQASERTSRYVFDNKAPEAKTVMSAAQSNDGAFGRRLGGVLEGCGLVDVDQEGRLLMWRGGPAGADLRRVSLNELRGAMPESGLIGEVELDADLAQLDDPSFVEPAPIMWTAWGRRPA